MDTDNLNAELLVNFPPVIPGSTGSVIPDPAVPSGEPVVGLPLSIFRLVVNQHGVLAGAVNVLVDPPPRDGPADDNIAIALWLNGFLLENRPIPSADRDKRTEFNLFQSSLIDGRNNKLEYKIHRPSGNVADSIPLWILYSEQLPGGNTVPGIEDHPYLEISLPAELGDPAVIGKDDVDKGVPLTVFYPFMKAHDVITVELRRERFTHKVLPGQEGKPVDITLTKAMFELAGNSPEFTFSYTAVDQLNNATDKRRWSKTLKADVDSERVVLDAPILREDLNDAADNPSIVDRDKLKGGPLRVVVLPKAPLFEAGDRVEGRFISTPSEVDYPLTGTIEKDGFGQFKACIMDVPNDQVVLDDQVRAAFTLVRGDRTVGASRLATARVIGEGVITLNPPTLVPPATSPIDVLNYPNGVTVRVTFAGNPGDKALLKEINAAPGSAPFPEQPFVAGESDFTLSPAFLVARHGKDIELPWVLIHNAAPAGESLPLGLRVNRIADGDTRLPTPTITAVTDDATLDRTSFTGNTHVLVRAWPGIDIGQRFWLRCAGKNNSGTTVTLPIHLGDAIGSAGDQGGEVTRAFLDQLANGSTIEVIALVNFDGVADESVAVQFPVKTYTVRDSFYMDTSLMTLIGLNVHSDSLALTGNDAPGTTQTRVPSAGDGVYTYLSSNSNVAAVDTTGKVTSMGNGTATITVTEASSQRRLSYDVKVTNVVRLTMTTTSTYSISAAFSWMSSIAGSPVSDAAIDVLKIKYRPLVSSAGGWLCRTDGCSAGSYLAVRTDTPSSWSIVCFTGHNAQAHGWCLVN